MVKALEDLKHEHRLIERVLAVLERTTQQLERDGHVSPETLERGLTFVRGFADGCHHAKEEHGLFPVLARRARPSKAVRCASSLPTRRPAAR